MEIYSNMSRTKTIWMTVAGVFSSILAFLGIVSCCGMPIIAGILATSGIGASQLRFFAEYRGWFISLAILLLLVGFRQVYFKKPGGCSCGCAMGDEKKPVKSQTVQKIVLWIGAALIVAILVAGNRQETKNDGSCCPVQNSCCTR